MCSISAEVANGVQTADRYRGAAFAEAFKQEHEAHKTGPLAEGAHHCTDQSLDLLSSPTEIAELKEVAAVSATPDMLPNNQFEMHAITSPKSATATILLIGTQRHPDRGPIIADTAAKYAAEDYLSLNAMLAHPFSHGSVYIQSSSRKKKPSVDFGYLNRPLTSRL